MKRREVERTIEQREDAEMRRKTEETGRLFTLYQQEKERQRNLDAQATSIFHLKQAVSYVFRIVEYLLYNIKVSVERFLTLLTKIKKKII
jgi:hypothetical protein